MRLPINLLKNVLKCSTGEIMPTKITKSQQRTLHVVKRKLSLDDSTYRSILSDYGVVSSSELSFQKAADCLSKLIATAKSIGKWQDNKVKDGMANFRQLAKIRAIWEEVSFTSDPAKRKKALDNFIQKKTGISRIEWLTREAAQKMLPILDDMRLRYRAKNDKEISNG